MTRRERLERKLEKRHEWADKASGRSNDAFGKAHRLADQIPLGQPILAGHHSERHARRDAERIHNNMSKGVQEADLAHHHEGKADGLERALERSIYSDDADAVEQLAERIAENEAKRERMKRVNALYRKGNAAGLAEFGLDLEAMRAKLNAPGVMSWHRIPYAAYELSNLGGRITADRKRLEAVKARTERAAKAAEAGGEVYIETLGEEYCRVTFAEKPERVVIDALKDAGFHWGAGSWSGKRASLPDVVAAWLPKEGSEA